jgi:hypothetical protein
MDCVLEMKIILIVLMNAPVHLDVLLTVYVKKHMVRHTQIAQAIVQLLQITAIMMACARVKQEKMLPIAPMTAHLIPAIMMAFVPHTSVKILKIAPMTALHRMYAITMDPARGNAGRILQTVLMTALPIHVMAMEPAKRNAAKILQTVPTIAAAIIMEIVRVGEPKTGQIAPTIARIPIVTTMVFANQTMAKIPITASMTVMKIKITAMTMVYARMI